MAFHEPSAIVKLLDQRGFKECEFVRLHTEKESESSMSFVRACFDGRRLTEFGEVVLKGLPGVVETLGTAPFEEGVWIAIKPDCLSSNPDFGATVLGPVEIQFRGGGSHYS